MKTEALLVCEKIRKNPKVPPKGISPGGFLFSIHRMYSVDDPQKGKLAKTGYKVLRESGKYSLLEMDLLTGRKNQIRVHFSEKGCPVAMDATRPPKRFDFDAYLDFLEGYGHNFFRLWAWRPKTAIPLTKKRM